MSTESRYRWVMVRGIWISIIAAILLMFGRAQDRKLYPSDTLPRERILTKQELFQYLDLSIPALAPISASLASGDTSGALTRYLRHLKTRTNPKYFVRSADMHQRVVSYAERHQEDLKYCDEATANYMKTYGTDADWRVPGRDLRGTPHTPNTVRFLARQLYAENFAVLATLKDDRSYVDFQMRQLRDFLGDVERGDVERGGNDVFERFYGGHRVRNLMMFHQMLLTSNMLNDEDHLLLIRSFLLHGAIIIEKCSKFNWGNHQLVGLCAMYEMTLMYPEFPVMREWNRRVYELIIEHLQKEVRDDGFQFERASHYFKLDVYNYFRVFRLAELNGEDIPLWARRRFRKMFDAIVAVLMPSGAMPPLQDAQDTYIGNRNIDDARRSLGVSETANSAELVDPSEGPFMTLGAYLFKEPRFKQFGDERLHPAFTWFLPEDADEVYQALGSREPDFSSIALAASRYYVMRSGWGKNDSYMIIDGGLAEYKPDHTHGGVLGVIAYSHGSMVLPNYRVRYSDPSYPYLKNSYAKNVALADSVVQGRGWIGNAAGTGFGKWAWLPTPTVHRWVTGRAFDYFRGSHNAFDTVGVSYERCIVFIKPSAWLVIDRFNGGMSEHAYRQIWQGTYVPVSPSSVRTVVANARLDIQQLNPQGLSVHQDGMYGTSSVVFSGVPATQRTFATVLRASASSEVPENAIARRTPAGFEMLTATGRVLVTFASEDSNRSDVTGDVQVVRFDHQGPVEIGAFGVTSVRAGGFLLTSRSPVSIELQKVSEREWVGFLTDGETETLSFLSPDGNTQAVSVSGTEPFNIRW